MVLILVDHSRPSSAWAIGGLAVILILASAATTYGELLPLFRSGALIEQKINVLVVDPLLPGPSYKSELLVLSDCNEALSSIAGNVLPPEPRQALLENCRSMARGVLADEPSFSFAWYIDALASEGLGDMTTVSSSLVQSQRTAARPQWLAQSRAYLASRNVDLLTPEARVAYEKDLATLVESDLSLPWLGQRYHRDLQFQALITDVVEKLSPEMQRRFVSAVRSSEQ